MAELLRARRQKHMGTYYTVPKVNWETLNLSNFNADGKASVDWNALYPTKAGKADEELVAKDVFTPRQAAKLFYDAIFIVEQAEKNPKYLQNKMPEISHKAFKRKQFQKQMVESMKRVCCRLAKGKGFSPNCVAEDVFIHIILANTFELGWRRLDSFLEDLPECVTDRDFTRVQRLAASGEVDLLWRGAEAVVTAQSKAKDKKATNGSILDARTWFGGYQSDATGLLDHVIDA